MRNSPCIAVNSPAAVFAALAVLSAAHVHAQVPQSQPDAGQLLNETQRGLDAQRLQRPVPPAPASSDVREATGAAVITVKAFRFQGARLLSADELTEALRPWLGKRLDINGLRQAADAVADIYRARGFLARTFLPEQDLSSGTVTIGILESRLSSLRVERIDGAGHLNEETVRAYVLARQAQGDVVKPDDLQRGITLLNDLPGVSASALLEPGERPGDSQVVVALRDTPRYTGSAQIDNTGSKSTGEARVTGSLNVNSPLRIGDQIQLLGNMSRGSTFGRIAYTLPMGADGVRLSGSVSHLEYDYSSLGSTFTGDATTGGLRVTFPITRSNNANFNVSLAYDRKDFTNQVVGTEINNKTVRVAGLTLSGDRADGLFGGGVNQYSATFSGGSLNLADNVSDFDNDLSSGAGRQGNFTKVNWQVQRLQRMGASDTLMLLVAGQSASRNLDSSEKLLGTGPFAVRAYSSSEASADEGVVMTIEWQHRFSEQLQASLFYDHASLQRDRRVYSGSLTPNTFDLSGVGVGLNWGQPGRWTLRATVATRLGSNPIRNSLTGQDADGTKRDLRTFATFSTFF